MSSLDIPQWAIGEEHRFQTFVKNIPSDARIALISHTDQDGIAAARVVKEYFSLDAGLLFFADYVDLHEDLVQKVRATGATYVVITDLMIKKLEFVHALEKFAQVLIIDHHQVDHDFTSPRTVFMNAQGFCAAYLAYYLFSKITSLERIDWIVACACISDWEYTKNQQWMARVFQKYGEHFTADPQEIKNGTFWDTQAAISLALVYFKHDVARVFATIGVSFRDMEDSVDCIIYSQNPPDREFCTKRDKTNRILCIGDLSQYASIIQREIDACIARFEKEKQVIEGGYFWEFTSSFPVKSIVSTIISAGMPDMTIVIAERRGDVYHLSGRRQDKKVSMNDLLKRLTDGFEPHDAGGHIPAAGGFIMIKDVFEFKKRLNVT